MKIMKTIAPLLAAAVMTGVGVRADDKTAAAGQSPLAPEFKELQRLVGSWSYVSTLQKAEWTPEEIHSAGKYACQWTLAGRYLEERGDDGEKDSHVKLYTFDEKRHAYRGWWFSSTGHWNDSEGTWDAAAKTFTWIGKIESGLTVTGKQHIVSDNVVEASVRVTDDTGKEYFHAEYKSTRLPETKK